MAGPSGHDLWSPMPAGGEGAGGPVPAGASGGFAVRFAARILDTVVATASGCCFGGVVGGFLGAIGKAEHFTTGAADQGLGAMAAQLGVGLCATLAGHTVAEGVAGTSVGKLMLGYRVVMADTGAPCTIVAAFVRSLSYYVDSFFFGLPAWLSMSSSPLNQRLGDRWGGTAVVRADSLGPASKHDSARVALGLAIGFATYGLVSASWLVIGGL